MHRLTAMWELNRDVCYDFNILAGRPHFKVGGRVRGYGKE